MLAQEPRLSMIISYCSLFGFTIIVIGVIVAQYNNIIQYTRLLFKFDW